jgi:hypothetical protein
MIVILLEINMQMLVNNTLTVSIYHISIDTHASVSRLSIISAAKMISQQYVCCQLATVGKLQSNYTFAYICLITYMCHPMKFTLCCTLPSLSLSRYCIFCHNDLITPCNEGCSLQSEREDGQC